MTQNERDAITALSERFAELKKEFEDFRDWLFKSGIGAASALVFIGIWVGTIQAGVWHGQQIDKDTADHAELLAVYAEKFSALERAAEADRAADDRIEQKLDELLAAMRRANATRRNQ